MSRLASRALPLLLLVLLSSTGCGDGEEAKADAADGATSGAAQALPAPQGAVGSVTGMPAHPGPGTSPIEPPASAQPGWADEDYMAMEDIEAISVQPSTPPPADVPPLILVPEIPQRPVATTVDPAAVPGTFDPETGAPEPIGTEGATESTTLVIEPDAGD